MKNETQTSDIKQQKSSFRESEWKGILSGIIFPGIIKKIIPDRLLYKTVSVYSMNPFLRYPHMSLEPCLFHEIFGKDYALDMVFSSYSQYKVKYDCVIETFKKIALETFEDDRMNLYINKIE